MYTGINGLYNEIDKLKLDLDLQHRKYERELSELKRKCDVLQLIQENDRRSMFCMPAGSRMPAFDLRQLYDDYHVVDKPYPATVADSTVSSLHSAQVSAQYSAPSSATAGTPVSTPSVTVLPSPPAPSPPPPPAPAPPPVPPPVPQALLTTNLQEQGKVVYETTPKYRLAKVHTVAEIWKEYNYGTATNPSLKVLEKKFGSSWRIPTEVRTFARRKAIFQAIEFGIRNGIPELQVIQDLERRREYVTEHGARKKRPLVWLSANIPSMYVHRYPTANLRL